MAQAVYGGGPTVLPVFDDVARQRHLAWPDEVGANTLTGG